MRETTEKIAEGMWLKRTWYDAERVRSETVVRDINGAPSATVCGPHRDYDFDGRLVREVLTTGGGILSPQEYEEARRKDPRLPAPATPAPAPDAYQAFCEAQRTDARYVAIRCAEIDRFCADRLQNEPAALLAELLSAGRPVVIGERSNKQSSSILRKLRDAPCKRVYAVGAEKIELPEGAVSSVSRFVLELPESATDRQAVRRIVRPWIRSAGYDVDKDIGQRYMFLEIK